MRSTCTWMMLVCFAEEAFNLAYWIRRLLGSTEQVPEDDQKENKATNSKAIQLLTHADTCDTNQRHDEGVHGLRCIMECKASETGHLRWRSLPAELRPQCPTACEHSPLHPSCGPSVQATWDSLAAPTFLHAHLGLRTTTTPHKQQFGYSSAWWGAEHVRDFTPISFHKAIESYKG